MSTYGLCYKNNMDLFINGMIRQIKLNLYIPVDIISIFKQMYSKQTIHLLKGNTKDINQSHHFVIDFDYVFVNSQIA